MSIKELAGQIFDRFDDQILEATHNTNIPPKFLAGLIGNEAGKDHHGQINPDAVRFEPAVYRHLIAVRDGHQKSYNKNIVQADLDNASDDAIHSLATSYGITQIMGWHVIHDFRCTIADLRDVNKHLFYTIKLLQLNNFPAKATEAKMDREMREWNSGSETGKTYDPQYVAHAQTMRNEYAILEKTRIPKPIEDKVVDTAQIEPLPEPAPAFVPENLTVNPAPPMSSVGQSAKVTVVGIVIPTFLVALFKTLQDLIAQGFVKADDVGNAVIGFITGNTKYFLILVALVILAIILKRLYGWITVWIEMFIAAIPHWHNVTVEKGK